MGSSSKLVKIAGGTDRPVRKTTVIWKWKPFKTVSNLTILWGRTLKTNNVYMLVSVTWKNQSIFSRYSGNTITSAIFMSLWQHAYIIFVISSLWRKCYIFYVLTLVKFFQNCILLQNFNTHLQINTSVFWKTNFTKCDSYFPSIFCIRWIQK